MDSSSVTVLDIRVIDSSTDLPAGLSYRKVAMLGRFSHAVRLVCIKCTTCPTGRKDSRAIAIDETKVRLHDKHIFIYARDVDSKEVLVVRCSYTRSVIDAETQREVLEYCTVLISPWLL